VKESSQMHTVPTTDTAPGDLERVAEAAERLERELGRTIVGQQRVIREILIAFAAGGHCLLRGVPGLAKTLLIKTLATGSSSPLTSCLPTSSARR
jgi:MoxR-like ATPase